MCSELHQGCLRVHPDSPLWLPTGAKVEDVTVLAVDVRRFAGHALSAQGAGDFHNQRAAHPASTLEGRLCWLWRLGSGPVPRDQGLGGVKAEVECWGYEAWIDEGQGPLWNMGWAQGGKESPLQYRLADSR